MTVAESLRKEVAKVIEASLEFVSTRRIRFGVCAIGTAFLPFLLIGVDFTGIETTPLFGIAQQVISCCHFRKLFCFGLVPGIEIRVKLFRQLPVRLFYIGFARRLGNAENVIRICRSILCHGCSLSSDIGCVFSAKR